MTGIKISVVKDGSKRIKVTKPNSKRLSFARKNKRIAVSDNKSKRFSFVRAGGAPNFETGFSTEAQAVFSRMPNPLVNSEKAAINRFVNAAVDSGNWDLLDRFFFFALLDPDNALTDWKTGATATNVNGASHTANEGYLFNGSTQYINTEFLVIQDADNFQQDSNFIGGYVYENFSSVNFAMLYGANDGVDRLEMFQQSDRIRTFNNGDQDVNFTGLGFFQNKTRYVNQRKDSNTLDLFINGVSEGEGSARTTNLPNSKIAVGARLSTGTPNLELNAKISYFFLGGDLNQSALDSELTQLENDLIV